MRTQNVLGPVFLLLAGLLGSPATAEVLSYPLADGHRVEADYQPGRRAAVLFLHQCNGDRRDLRPLGDWLARVDIASLSPDQRGYGGSVDAGPNLLELFERGDPEFGRAEYQRIRALWPADAAIHAQQLRQRSGARLVAIVSASCGSDIALQLMVRDPQVCTVVSLSGRMFEPVRIAAAASDKPVWVIAAEDDGEFAGEARDLFIRSSNPHSRFSLFPGDRHGAPLLAQDPTLAGRIADWIEAHALDARNRCE